MSSNVPMSVVAFGKILQAYYTCKSSPERVSGYGTLSGSVNHVTGKVHVCPQDLIADVEMAGRRALNNMVNEYHLFRRIYLEADTDFAKLVSEKLGKEVFASMIAEVESRVGAEFIDAKIYPLKRYISEVDTR